MKLLTIGEFARLSRLSPKALRLYDELGLLRPFRVDEWAGDRYLITSDGLTNVVPAAAIRETLSTADLSPEEVVRRLIALANEAGGPDNIALALADITETA